MEGLKVQLITFSEKHDPRHYEVSMQQYFWYKPEHIVGHELSTALLPVTHEISHNGLKVISYNYSLAFSSLSICPVVITSCTIDVRTNLDMGTP